MGDSDEDERAPPPKSPRTRPRRRDALIALNSPGLAAMAVRVAAAFGFCAVLAESAGRAPAHASVQAFDLILLEANAETALWVRCIRALPGASGAAPIVALGASCAKQWREDAADAGVDGFVSQPVTSSRLIEMIALLLGAQGHPDAPSSVGTAELNPIEHDDGDDENGDDGDGGHVFPADSKS